MPSNTSDGFAGMFKVPELGVPVAVCGDVANLAVALSEVIEQIGPARVSVAQFDITNVDVTEGEIISVGIEQKRDASLGFGGITFKGQPADGDTITVGAKTYRFKTALAAINDVKIDATSAESTEFKMNRTADNLRRAINLDAPNDGTIYYAGTVQNSDALATITQNFIQVVTRTGGVVAVVLSTTSSAIDLMGFQQGAAADADGQYIAVGNFKVNGNGPNGGWTGLDSAGTFQVRNIPYSTIGIVWKFRLKFFNSDGQPAINTLDKSVIVKEVSAKFNGIADLTEWAEVTNLRVSNATDPEGNLTTPSPLPPNGIARLAWMDMTRYPSLKLHPFSGPSTGGTQTKADITRSQLASLKEYVVWMFICTGTTAPAANWPRQTDPNGTWYLVKRVKDTEAEISCPANKAVCFWVGFGTEKTAQETSTPVARQLAFAQYS